MAEIDSLSISISAEASKAEKSLDKLTSQLDKLSTSLSRASGSGFNQLATGVTRLTNAMSSFSNANLSGSFTKLAHSLEKVNKINTAGIGTIASAVRDISSAMSQLPNDGQGIENLALLASSIPKLGGKRVETAIATMPRLANALNNLFATLSQSPEVSRNLIDMTNALSNLAQHSRQLNSTVNSVRRGLGQVGGQVKSSRGLFTKLASTIGRVYATFFIFVRGLKYVWKSIKSAMNYSEVLNYFDKAFTQVADKADLSAWDKLGYKSADEYYKSFQDRAKQYTDQMTGFSSSASGVLSSTGGLSLGLNPTQVMNTQAIFGQISSSMNVTSEDALKLSRVMTELGADLASVKNMSFEDTWGKLQSGLVGMSRSLDAFGVNIRESNLQVKLQELGINTSVDSLSQYDKALLRTIVTLDSTRYAWSDMAETIQSPANQLRLLQSNFTMLSQTLGSMFVPVVASILPYVRALTIALTQALEKIRDFLGLAGMDWGGASSGAENLSDIYDAIADDVGKATDSVVEFQRQIMGFDEINKLDEQKDKGSATGVSSGLISDAFNKAYEEYQRAWDASYAKVDNSVQKLADNIEKRLEKIAEYFKPFTNSIVKFAGSLVKLAKVRGPLDKGFAEGLVDAIGFLVNDVGATGLSGIADGISKFADYLSKNLSPQQLEDIGKALGRLSLELLAIKKIGKVALVVTIAIEGFNIGKEIGKLINPDATYYYDNFEWSEFFGAIKEQWGGTLDEMLKIFESWNGNIQVAMFKTFKNSAGDALAIMVQLINFDFKNLFSKKNILKVLDNIPTAFDAVFYVAKRTILGQLLTLPSELAQRVFNIESWTFSGIWEGLKKSFENGVAAMKNVWNNFANYLNDHMTIVVPSLQIAGKKLTDSTNISLGHLPTFAHGGFPEDGLFMANHNELVGQFSNGRTTVANNTQIIEGIKQGVIEAMMIANSGNSGKTVVESNLYLDGDLVAKAVNRANNRQDRRYNPIAAI